MVSIYSYMTETYTGEDNIGDYLTIYAEEGDTIEVTTAFEEFKAKLTETPNQVPVDKSDSKEILCETEDDRFIYLYADVQDMTPNRIKYYIDVVEAFEDGDVKNLGKIEKVAKLDSNS